MKTKHGSYNNYTKNKKINALDYVNKTIEMYEGDEDKIDPPILKNNIDNRYVNKSLNKFENRTDNKHVVTFDPTTQLFTDGTRNIAFKTYDQAKRWNDTVNGQPTAKASQVNDLKARLDNARSYGSYPKQKKDHKLNSQKMAEEIVDHIKEDVPKIHDAKTDNYYPGAASLEDSVSQMPVEHTIRPKKQEPGLSHNFTHEKLLEGKLIKEVLDE